MPHESGLVHIRAAVPGDADALTALALRSKAFWGYSTEFMEKCRPLLTVTSQYIGTHPVFVAEQDGAVTGFYALGELDGSLEMDLLFVEPGCIRSGIGAALLRHALRTAAGTRHAVLHVESDPQAEAFYERLGGVRAGQRESSIEPGRYLPILEFDLRPTERPGAS